MSEGRFTLALGAGERLNEHVIGRGWPAVHERHEMLREACEVIRLLWSGETCTHDGPYHPLDSARLYDLPERPIPLVIGVSGEKSVCLAARGRRRLHGGRGKARTGRAVATGRRRRRPALWRAGARLCGQRAGRLELAHRYLRFGAFDWSVLAELPNVGSFEAASKFVTPEDLAEAVPHGPDVEPYVGAVRKFVDAGFDHVVLLAAGDAQEAFIRFFETELADALRAIEGTRRPQTPG